MITKDIKEELENIIEFSFLKGLKKKASELDREKRKTETQSKLDKRRKEKAEQRRKEVEKRLQALKKSE